MSHDPHEFDGMIAIGVVFLVILIAARLAFGGQGGVPPLRFWPL